MSETKMFAVIAIAICAFGICAVVSNNLADKDVDVEKEKTKQLELKFKSDSLNYVLNSKK